MVAKDRAFVLQTTECMVSMDGKEFLRFRTKLNKTQQQMAQLLGASVKAVRSYEQGWRSVPTHVERQILFLVSSKRAATALDGPCWEIKECPVERRCKCPAWEFGIGHLCWFINGTICEGAVQADWQDKMRKCRQCVVLGSVLDV